MDWLKKILANCWMPRKCAPAQSLLGLIGALLTRAEAIISTMDQRLTLLPHSKTFLGLIGGLDLGSFCVRLVCFPCAERISSHGQKHAR